MSLLELQWYNFDLRADRALINTVTNPPVTVLKSQKHKFIDVFIVTKPAVSLWFILHCQNWVFMKSKKKATRQFTAHIHTHTNIHTSAYNTLHVLRSQQGSSNINNTTQWFTLHVNSQCKSERFSSLRGYRYAVCPTCSNCWETDHA